MVRIPPPLLKAMERPLLEGVPRCPILRGRKLTRVINHLHGPSCDDPSSCARIRKKKLKHAGKCDFVFVDGFGQFSGFFAVKLVGSSNSQTFLE